MQQHRTRLFSYLAAFLLCMCAMFGAHAQTSAEISLGVQWLGSQVQQSGSLQNEAASIATPLQNRSEVIQTLKLLSSVPPSLSDAVVADVESNTEFLARRIITITSSGQDASSLIQELSKYKNDDGGFGGGYGYTSNALDTAWALVALKAANTTGDQIAAALNYLEQSKQADGGWGVQAQSQVFITSLVLAAANEWKNSYAVGAITNSARDWLLNKTSNGVFGTPLENAVGLLALATQTAQPAVLQPIVDSVKAAQKADGSWESDPFITALSLRALWLAAHPVVAPTTGDLSGTLLDAQTGMGLAGATVQIVEDTAFSTTTNANGNYSLHGLPPGQYTVRVTKLTYQTMQVSVQIQAGSTLTVSTLSVPKASLTASLSGVAKDANGTPLQDVVFALGGTSANTNQSGAYQLSGLGPGLATVTATKQGYQNVSVDINFAAGVSYTFSPTLYSLSATPPTTSLKGKVVDATTGSPIVNASVILGQSTQLTKADGTFVFSNQTATPFALTISATGYQVLTASGTMSVGANDIGSISLTRVPATSTIIGSVTDAQTGAAISGATISVQGTNLSTTSAANGSYQISGLTTTSFKLMTAATGYLSNSYNVTLPQVGTSTVNLQLVMVQPSGITFDTVKPSKPEYGATDEWKIETSIKNTTTATANLAVDAQIFDAQSNIVQELKANAIGLGFNPPNLPLVFAAGSTTDVDLEKQVIRQPPGLYTAIVRAYDTNGVAVAEATTSFTVRAEAVLSGAVIVDPPLAQAGTNAPVHISAQLGNLGNEPIPAGVVDLTVTLTNPDTSVSTQLQTSVQTLTTGSPLNSPRGLVADAAGNLYTANSAYSDGRIIKIDPQGQQSVFATIPGSKGPNLIDLVLDSQGNLWTANRNGQKIWQVNPQGIVAEVTISSLDVISGIDIDSAGNLFVTGSKGNDQRLIKRSPQGIETLLWANGLSSPTAMIKDNQGNLVVSNNGDGTLVKISPNGLITPFVSGLNRPKGLAIDAAGNIYVANNGDGKIIKVGLDGSMSDYATGLPAPVDIKFDPNGVLYVSAQADNAIYKVLANGSVELFAKGIASGPQGMKYDASGNLYIVNDDGTLRMRDSSDQVSILTTGMSTPRGLDINASGDIYIATYGAGSLTKVTGTAKTTVATGLSAPYGVAIDGSGNIHVTEYGANRIIQLDSTGAVASRVESVINQPTSVQVAADGNLYVLNNGYITVIENGTPRILLRNFPVSAIAADSLNGGVAALRSYDVYHISSSGLATKVKTLPFYPYSGIAVDGAGRFAIPDYYGKKLVKVDSSGAISASVDLPGYPSAVTADANGSVYVLVDTRKVLQVADDGTSSVVYSATENLSGMSISSDGRPLVWTGSGKIIAITPSTGAAAVLKTGYLPSGVTMDASNQLITVVNSENRLVTFDSSGAEVSSLDGFNNPRDIIWTGSELRFVDSNNRLFRMIPGGYPVRIANAFNAYYLAQRGGDTYGTNGGAIYKWDGTTTQTAISVANANSLSGITAKPDGTLSVAENGTSRVLIFDSANNVTHNFAGLISPQGLAVDSQGRLYVANSGGTTIARFEAGSKIPQMFARSSNPYYLAFDTSGNLWVSHSSSIDRISAQGVVSTVSSSFYFQGLFADDSGVYAASPSLGHVRKFNGQTWDMFAAGLSTPEGVRVAADSTIYVANRGNNTVTKLTNGNLDVIAGDLTSPHALGLSADGKLYVGGDSGTVSQIAVDGTITPLNVSSMISNRPVTGLLSRADGKLMVLALGSESSLFQMAITQPVAPPAAGTVVYHAQQAIDAIAVGDTQLPVDFGTWVPPYGGDYQVEVSYPNVPGLANNFLHVGPFAQGTLTVATASVPPGDQKVAMSLRLTGADFTSISRVETSLVRKLVSIAQPKGMVGDKAGNIWYTDSASLNKTTPAGITTIVVPNISPAFGLAVDDQERFYLPVRNPTSGHYELLRVLTDGTKAAVVDLGTAQVNGVAVNSSGDVLIGSIGKLLKYSVAANTLSVVATAGLPQPRGIAIDGRDNVYVQNEANFVSLIKPDASAVAIFAKGDGVQDPIFEGDGYPNIAADCADNFYIAPSYWARIKQSGEEHTLAQVIARTGQVSTLFNGLQISSYLSDIDYLAYDRFASRILMWTHGVDQIWQVPVTCGAIGVEAHLIAKPGQVLTGLSTAPNAAIPLTGGRTEYVWSLRDVTAQGLSIGFDTVLSGLQLGELRNTIDSAYLLFKNTFSADDVRLPLDVPQVRVANLVNVGAATDRPEYLVNEAAQVSTSLSNTNPGTVAGDLEVDVYDAANVLVGHVVQQGVIMAANETIAVNGLYNIGTIVPGVYTVKAMLTNNGVVEATATTTFRVLGDQSQATARSTLSVDKQRYAPRDRVTITSRATDQSANVFLDNLLLNVKVMDSANTELFSKTYPIAQLAPGMSSTYSTPYTLQNAGPGAYHVVQVLSEAAGRIYDTQTATFEVTSTSDTGAGLIGAIIATPKTVVIGDVLAFSASATNNGNNALTATALKIAIVDPANQQILAEFPFARDLSMGETINLAASWTAQGTVGSTYVAVLTATIGTKIVTLAQDNFTLLAPPVNLGINQSITANSRVLVLVSCNDDDNVNDDNNHEDGHEHDDGNDGSHEHETSSDATNSSSCMTGRSQAIDTMLTALGVSHAITTNEESFRQAFRSGVYNTYWISGKEDKLHGDLVSEVREAVFGGDGLILDGVHDERNKTLDAVAGIQYRGKVGETGLTVNISGPDFVAASLETVSRVLKLDVNGGVQQAIFTGTMPHTDGPAIITHAYGAGRSVLFAFDLVSSEQAQPLWQPVLASGLQLVTPAQPANLTPGGLVSVTTSIRNLANAVDVDVKTGLPSGGTALGSDPTGTIDSGANTIDWAFNLVEGQSKGIFLTFRAPPTAGDFMLHTVIGTVKTGTVMPYGDPLDLPFSVIDAGQTQANVVATLQGFVLSQNKEKKLRASIIGELQSAMANFSLNTRDGYEATIEGLVEAIDLLSGLTSVDTRGVHENLVRILRETQWRWSQMPPVTAN